jgi:2-keto-4-pentenoate hydratase/2-oxohepta-3-ene-1,7-dioic acid hydratase in catechol pathway
MRIATGTPQGVGMGRPPPRCLTPGDVLASYVEGIGEMRHRRVPAGRADANTDPDEER